jgi:G3E family GTPase
VSLPTTLVTGNTGQGREAAIAAALSKLDEGSAIAAILEGLPSGQDLLPSSPRLDVHRIAPGCFCCTGNLVLRVTLNRLLRRPPARLYIGLANSEHLDQLRSWLQAPPYDQLLELLPDLHS